MGPARPAHRTPALRALSYRFAVHSDDHMLGRHVDELLFGLRDPRARGEADHLYSLSAAAGDPSRVDVLRDGETVALGQCPGDAVAWVVWDVNRSAAEASGDHLLLHAGALDANGTGVLVPGPSGSGKSTLVAGLARAGLGYLTDELVALDLTSGHLQPYAKPITVKRGSFSALADMLPSGAADPITGRWSGEECSVRVGPGSGLVIGRPCAPAFVVVPRYEPAAPTALRPLTPTDAFLSLAANAVNLLEHGGTGASELGSIVARSTCVALTVSDLDEACALVLELVARHVLLVPEKDRADAG
jgi:hypothetical protein